MAKEPSRIKVAISIGEKGFALNTIKMLYDLIIQARKNDVSVETMLDLKAKKELQHYYDNREQRLAQVTAYNIANREAKKAYSKTYTKKEWKNILSRKKDKYHKDPYYHAYCTIRAQNRRVRQLAKTRKKEASLVAVGYSPAEYYQHMLATLPKGYSYEECSHDHIIPIAFFLRNGITDISVINSLDNLRLLPKKENEYKHAHVDLSLARGKVFTTLEEKGLLDALRL
jgi:hypothetical protein